MLLLIALANVPWFLYGAPTSGVTAHRAGATGPDAVWQTIAMISIDARVYPLFAFLFGYGIWQYYVSKQAAGRDEAAVRRLLRLRHGWLLAFGATHAALLWHGDVLGAYGLVGLLAVGLFLRRRDSTLLVWALGLAGVLACLSVLALAVGAFVPSVIGQVEVTAPQLAKITPYLDSVLPRLRTWVPLTIGQGVLGLVVPISVLAGIGCARLRLLESPWNRRRLLARTAVVGIAAGWLGAVPTVLVHHGIGDLPEWAPIVLHGFTGLFAALGYAALITLLVARRSSERQAGRFARGLIAVGQRSLSCYLLQSLLFAVLLSAWGLGLGAVLAQWQAALLAVGVWLGSLAFAVALERDGRRGPAEWLLRALVDRRHAGEPARASKSPELERTTR